MKPTRLPFLLVLAASLACATAQVDSRDVAPLGSVAKPPITLVYDFAVGVDDVQVDQWDLKLGSAPQRVQPTEEQRRVAERISRAFTDELVADLNGRGIRSKRAIATTPAPENAILLQGVFVAIDEGDELKRTVVGLGQGNSRVQARIRAYQQTRTGRRYLGMGTVTAEGSRKPGIFVSGASAAATGSVGGLVFAGAQKAAAKGGVDDPLPADLRDGAKADVERAARAVAEEVEARFRAHGLL